MYESENGNTAMVERSTSKTNSQGGMSNKSNNVAKNSKRGKQQNTISKRSESNQIVSQKRSTNRNKAPTFKQQHDSRVRREIERDNICFLERLAKIMNPPKGGIISSAYNLKRPPKHDQEKAKLRQQKLEFQRVQIENENIVMLERLADIMAPRSGGPSWNDYKKGKWSTISMTQEKLPQISQEPRSVMSRKPMPKQQKDVPMRKDSIEAANLLMLERLAKVMAPTPGGPSWKDYESKTYGASHRSTGLPSIPKDKGGMKQKRQKYSTSDQNDKWKDINQKLPPVSSNNKKNEN
ncbi:uncharacterized protein LOC122539893 [Chiloscyllium plagiosum]|uniref:uncharacterized protein LOC122539893 n=1 Tax=Chiloscyllium plagiosum TaxID=36176 RepID=UPI001CB84214|nr:uncharacterized protein LOC122539893 [Chiloscyllium plagiosum]